LNTYPTPPTIHIITGTYTIASVSGKTVVCNDPNNLSDFATTFVSGSAFVRDSIIVLENQSLQRQLDAFQLAYKGSFLVANSTFAYNPNVYYTSGQYVHLGGIVYITLQTVRGITPGLSLPWVPLGDLKIESGAATNNLQFSSSTLSFTCVSVTMQPERITFGVQPVFKTKAPRFKYDSIVGLFQYTADVRSFGDLPPYYTLESIDGNFTKDIRNFSYQSWGYKNACSGVGTQGAEEYFNFESNSAFKFLMDNFETTCVEYTNPATNDVLAYWVWQSSGNPDDISSVFSRTYVQASESLSSCTSPVQSIVVVSRTILVLPSLSNSAGVVSDLNLAAQSVGVSGDYDTIIAEFSIPPGPLNSMKSIIRYQPDHVTYYAMQSTKTFKQLDYQVCFRHRITQRLVPLILSNYGNVNIKIVFKPT